MIAFPALMQACCAIMLGRTLNGDEAESLMVFASGVVFGRVSTLGAESYL